MGSEKEYKGNGKDMTLRSFAGLICVLITTLSELFALCHIKILYKKVMFPKNSVLFMPCLGLELNFLSFSFFRIVF